MTVDPKKPLRFRMPYMQPVKLVGVTSTGDIIVETESDKTQTPASDTILQFRPDGALRCGRDYFSPRLVNDTVIDSAFWPLDKSVAPYGRGLTILNSVWSDFPNANFALEIIRHDGVPKEAKIHARP